VYEPWWNRTTNLLIKSFYQIIDSISLNSLRAAFSGNFRTFPHSFRQQTGNRLLDFCRIIEDIDDRLTGWRNPFPIAILGETAP